MSQVTLKTWAARFVLVGSLASVRPISTFHLVMTPDLAFALRVLRISDAPFADHWLNLFSDQPEAIVVTTTDGAVWLWPIDPALKKKRPEQ
jgi:hypothetical protein